ncbi:hypothetical protein Tco_0195586 [Tanacetum coccineum]
MLVAYTNEGRWEVNTLIEVHNCIQSREINACTSRFLSDHVIKTLATNPDIPVRAVQDQMQKQFDVSVSKMKAFRAKRIAIDKMIGSPWPGQILTAVRVDANNGICPVAYSIVEAKSKAYWYSFNPILNLNCPQGLIQAIASVFPSAEHKYCVRHIHKNMKSQFKGGVYKDMLWNAARATTVGEFNKKMGELKSYNSAAYDWLMKIPAEQWSRSYFSGRAKCDRLLNNICEVFDRQEIWPVVESITIIIPPNHKPQVGRPPKKRKKSHDEIASQSCSSGKLARKSILVKCSKYGNLGHNMKGCRGQGGASQVGGSSQAGARQAAGARNVSC